jgi:hypothetical protein
VRKSDVGKSIVQLHSNLDLYANTCSAQIHNLGLDCQVLTTSKSYTFQETWDSVICREELDTRPNQGDQMSLWKIIRIEAQSQLLSKKKIYAEKVAKKFGLL